MRMQPGAWCQSIMYVFDILYTYIYIYTHIYIHTHTHIYIYIYIVVSRQTVGSPGTKEAATARLAAASVSPCRPG